MIPGILVCWFSCVSPADRQDTASVTATAAVRLLENPEKTIEPDPENRLQFFMVQVTPEK